MRRVGKPLVVPTAKATVAGEHRNIGRAALFLSALAESAERGLRFQDAMDATGLSKATTYRTLNGLVAHGLAEFDEASGRYLLGMRLFGWLMAAGQRSGIVRMLEPALDRLTAETEDTVYLMVRSGPDAICVDRREGAYPIKTLTRRVGDMRPLGIGGASLALLAFLPDAEVERLMSSRKEQRRQFRISDAKLLSLIKQARVDGYSSIDGAIHDNMWAIGMPFFGMDGRPIAAISVATIGERMQGVRRKEIIKLLRREATAFHNALGVRNA